MINLLPTEEKKILKMEERWRLILILELIMLFFFISLTLILSAVRISIVSQVDVQKASFEQKEKETNKADSQDQYFRKEITQTNQMILGLDYFYQQQVSINDFLEKISKLIPSGISLNQILIIRVKEQNKFKVSLSGHAYFDEDLRILSETLNKEKEFDQINFPKQIWDEQKNIDFSNITFEVNF